MMMVKTAENGVPPPQGLVDAMDEASEEAMRDGTMIDMGGLAATAMSARVRLSDGKLAVTDGPFTEAKEVVGGYAMMELASKEEAVAQAVWLMNLHKEYWPGWEGEVEVRQIFA